MAKTLEHVYSSLELPGQLRAQRIARLSRQYGKYAQKVGAKARTRGGMDRIFTVRSPQLCRALIRWRHGSWGHVRYMLCACGGDYSFGHFQGCQNLQPKVAHRPIEPLLEARRIDERSLTALLEGWDAQLAAAPNQRADTSRLTVHTKQPASVARRSREAERREEVASTRPEEEEETEENEGEGYATAEEIQNDVLDDEGYITAESDL